MVTIRVLIKQCCFSIVLLYHILINRFINLLFNVVKVHRSEVKDSPAPVLDPNAHSKDDEDYVDAQRENQEQFC
jgi:hypothetical protein